MHPLFGHLEGRRRLGVFIQLRIWGMSVPWTNWKIQEEGGCFVDGCVFLSDVLLSGQNKGLASKGTVGCLPAVNVVVGTFWQFKQGLVQQRLKGHPRLR
eukprot:6483657-Amphidinium_carterae.1